LIVQFILLALALYGIASAGDPSVRTASGPAEIESLKEANRILEEEIKLASRPQIYLVIDLSARIIHIKSRGLELHQLPILAWRVSETGSLAGVHRLRARPEVSRPKAAPDPSLEPIALEDMPGEYALQFDSGLLLTVAPPAREQPWLWMTSRLREGWIRVTSRIGLTGSDSPPSLGPFVRLTVSKDAARSLAWSVTDGMPFLVSRAIEPVAFSDPASLR
jgi:hypothetical protein